MAFAILRVEVAWARGAERPASRHTLQVFKACVFSPTTPARHTYTRNHTHTRLHVHMPTHPQPRSPLSPRQETSRQLKVTSLPTALLRAPLLRPGPSQAFFSLILTPAFHRRVLPCCRSASYIFCAPTRLWVGMKDLSFQTGCPASTLGLRSWSTQYRGDF